MKKNDDGTYQHEVLVSVKYDRLGCLQAEDTSGNIAFLQFEADVAGFFESYRFIDGDMHDLDHGWPCICAVYDEYWSLTMGE